MKSFAIVMAVAMLASSTADAAFLRPRPDQVAPAPVQPPPPPITEAVPLQPMPPPKPRPRRTVAWFMEHHGERRAKLAACRNDPGSRDGECINASEAESHLGLQAELAQRRAAR